MKWFLRKVRFVVFSQIFVGRVSRPRARATFAPGGKSSQKRRLDLRSKNPLRAVPNSDSPHLLADIAFRHRCRSKGLRLRSPARRLPRPLAPATVGFFAPTAAPLKPSPWGEGGAQRQMRGHPSRPQAQYFSPRIKKGAPLRGAPFPSFFISFSR